MNKDSSINTLKTNNICNLNKISDKTGILVDNPDVRK
jgi:hypothetical protein